MTSDFILKIFSSSIRVTVIDHKGDYAYYGSFSNLGYEI